VHPEVQELQAKLKEILYDCAIELRATKAALYLFDPEAKRYELITEYGFRGTIRPWADGRDPLIDRSQRSRNPFYVNGLMAEPRLSDILYQSATDRMLVAPIFLRGQLVGVVDMRDKAGKQPFDQSDLVKGQRIADRVGELFSNKNVFSQRFITLSGTSTPMPEPSPPPAAPPSPAEGKYPPHLSKLIEEAGAATERLSTPAPAANLDESEIGVIREMLRVMLLIPGVVASSLSAFGHLGGFQEVVSKSAMTDDAVKLLQSKLNSWLTNRGESGGSLRANVQLSPGAGGEPITPQQIQKVFTAPVAAGSMRSLYLSVAFTAEPDRTAHELLGAFHSQLQIALDQAIGRRDHDALQMRIAEKLLEPDFEKYPELRGHTHAVVARTEAFGRFLGITQHEIETMRIVAMVHDVGMRLLDYDRLYRKRDLSHDELTLLQQHPVVGAALVEPLLGREIARAVLSHHERFDGGGYPNDLRGTDIPFPARLVQICDIYEAMTAADNYQVPLSHDAAMAVIGRGAGSQFDGELAATFQAMMAASR